MQKNTPFLLFATVWHVKRREIQTQKPKEGICVFFYMTGKADPVLGRCQEMTSCSGLQNRRKTPCLLSFYFQRLSLRKCSAQSLCQSLSIIRWNESCVNSFSHMGGYERKLIKRGCSFYSPIRYSELPRYYRDSTTPDDVAIDRKSVV